MNARYTRPNISAQLEAHSVLQPISEIEIHAVGRLIFLCTLLVRLSVSGDDYGDIVLQFLVFVILDTSGFRKTVSSGFTGQTGYPGSFYVYAIPAEFRLSVARPRYRVFSLQYFV
jgi:hypothetical protein